MNTWSICSLLCLVVQTAFSQSLVYLEGKMVGRGVMKARANECFIIAPAHVVGETMSMLNVMGPRHSRFKAELVETYDADLAILRVKEGGSAYCEEWDITPNYDKLLADSHACFLEMADPQGGIDVMDVVIVGKGTTYVDVRPYYAKHEITEGMSGSSLFTKYQDKKIYLGMLVTVDTKGNAIIGNVLQASVMSQTLNNFFKLPDRPVADSKKKKVTIIVRTANSKSVDEIELAQEASKILVRHYPEYIFTTAHTKTNSRDVICEISEQTVNELDNVIDKNIHKYKSKITLTVYNQRRLISQEILTGGAIDYSRERAQWLSIQNALDESRQLVFSNP